MAIVMTMTLPEGVPVEMLDEVSDEMDVHSDPPPGLIVHTHSMVNGRVVIFDVWESDEQWETFQRDRLGPAVAKVAQSRGVDMSGPDGPAPTTYDVHQVVRGR